MVQSSRKNCRMGVVFVVLLAVVVAYSIGVNRQIRERIRQSK